jgi:hypothetical protein
MITLIKNLYNMIFIEKRLPYSWSIKLHHALYKNKLDAILQSITNTPTITCQLQSKTVAEVHLVTCKRDLYMAIFSLKSFLRFVPNISVVVHGDESFDDECSKIFREELKNSVVISYQQANELTNSISKIKTLRKKLPALFASYTSGSNSQAQRNAWALKVFDFHLFSQSNKVIILDSDTLFLKKPQYIIDWLANDEATGFYAAPRHPNLKVDESLYKETFPDAHVIKSFNGGLLGFNTDLITLENLISVVKKIEEKPNLKIFGDECIWRFALSHIDSLPLSFDQYPLFTDKTPYKLHKKAVPNDIVYMHFLLKHKAGIYNYEAKKVLNELIKSTD